MEVGSANNSSITAGSAPDIVRQLEHDIGVVSGVLGIILNALLLLVLCRKKQILGNISGRIVINQSIIDLVVSVFLIWSQYHSFMFGPNMPLDVGEPWLYCNLIWSTYFLWGAITASTWNLQILTIERYMSVCHPFQHREYCTRLVITISLLLVWVMAYTWQIFVIIFFQYDELSGQCLLIPHPPEAFPVYSIGFQVHAYFVPVFLMSFCYIRMIKVIRKRVSSDSQQASDKEKQTRAFVITCFLISAAYVVCYTLNSFYFILSSVLSLYVFNPMSAVYKISVLMTFINSFINPLIYFSRMKVFRRELRAMLTCKQRIVIEGSGSHTDKQTYGRATVAAITAKRQQVTEEQL